MIRLAVVILVDPQGRLLLQERDGLAPIAPDQWGMVGGHVEDGEDVEPAAYRELEEETGVRLEPGTLTLWRDEVHRFEGGQAPRRYTVWVAPTRLTDADIVVGEGRQIVFVAPAEVPTLDLAWSSRHFLPRLLASDSYAALLASHAG
jgi:8-oxo-dGTP pyrophosphatase MutT (NUDIX family)